MTTLSTCLLSDNWYENAFKKGTMAANTTTMGLVGVGATVASVVADMTLLVPMEKPVQQMEKNNA
jgi:uncharacterized membrane protein YcjF (UPF0283 family)